MYPSRRVTFPSPEFRRRLALAALGGALLAAAHPPYGAWPLAFLAGWPLLAAIRPDGARREGGRNAAVGLVAGYAFFLPLLFWITHVTRVFGNLPAPVAGLVWLLFASVFAVDLAALAWALGRIARRGPVLLAALFPVAWVAQEWIRSWLWTGFPWGLLNQALVPRPELLWPSTWLGGSFVSALVATVGALLFLVLHRFGSRSSLLGFGLLAALAATWGGGAVLVGTREARGPVLRVAVIQPNVPQGERWSPERADAIWRDLEARTLAVAAREPGLVIWPESAMPWDIDEEPPVAAAVAHLAGRIGAPILVNTVRFAGDGKLRNSARLVLPGGLAAEVADKRHLVPFGEYVPRPFAWAGKIVRGIGDFSPGEEVAPLPVPFLSRGESMEALLGVAICYEAVYPDVFRDGARGGANLVATITNDAWYGGLGAEEQHWNGAVAAAVESGRSLARAAITGISGLVDDRGRVLGRVPYGTDGAAVADLPLSDRAIPSHRLAGVVPVAAFVLTLCAILFASRPRRGDPGNDEFPDGR